MAIGDSQRLLRLVHQAIEGARILGEPSCVVYQDHPARQELAGGFSSAGFAVHHSLSEALKALGGGQNVAFDTTSLECSDWQSLAPLAAASSETTKRRGALALLVSDQNLKHLQRSISIFQSIGLTFRYAKEGA